MRSKTAAVLARFEKRGEKKKKGELFARELSNGI